MFNNSRNLASSSQDVRPHNAETARRDEKGIVEYADSITSLPKKKWNVESYWWNLFSLWSDGLPENSFLRNEILGNFLTPMEFQSWKLNFRIEVLYANSGTLGHNCMDQRN